MIATFTPRPSLRSAHAMTLYSWATRGIFPAAGADAAVFRRHGGCAGPRGRHWQPRRGAPDDHRAARAQRSSHAHYIRGLSAKAFARGMNVVRLNQRNCGDTERLSAGRFTPA